MAPIPTAMPDSPKERAAAVPIPTHSIADLASKMVMEDTARVSPTTSMGKIPGYALAQRNSFAEMGPVRITQKPRPSFDTAAN